jgi:uncharacterized protein (DUF1501 family)
MMTRRQILRFLLRSGVTLPFVNYASLNKALAQDPLLSLGASLPPIEDRIIVLIRMFGGNDGFNSVIPFTDETYYKIRNENALEPCSIAENEVLRLNGSVTTGFHPAMTKLRDIYNDNKCAIIQNVGYPNHNMSHFRSTDIWLSGSDTDVFEQTGWLGRYFEQKYTDFKNNLPKHPPAIEFSRSVSRLLQSKEDQFGFAYNGIIPIPEKPDILPTILHGSRKEQDFILSIQKESHAFIGALTEIEAKSVKNTVEYPAGNTIASDLAHTARLIASGAKTNVYSLITDNMFDNHQRLMVYHNHAIGLVDSAVGTFQKDIENLGIADRVVLVLFSEFGRRLKPNGTGTDHGTACPVFIIGTNIKGGIYGNNPDLNNLDENGNIEYKIDFRQIYATLLSSWFGASVSDIFPAIVPHFLDKIPFFNVDSEVMENMLIFPNPSSTSITITIGLETIQSFRVYNLEGKQQNLPHQNYQSYGVNIDVSSISSGTYFIEAIKNNKKYYSSFVKVNQ